MYFAFYTTRPNTLIGMKSQEDGKHAFVSNMGTERALPVHAASAVGDAAAGERCDNS